MRQPNRGSFALACTAAGLLLAAASLWAEPGPDPAADAGGPHTRVEKRVVLIDGDGKQQVWSSDGDSVKRGYLGVGLTDLTPELRAHFGAPESAGVMVSRIEPGSPAEKTGIKVGDIVTAIDGKPAKSSFDVREKVRGLDDGAALSLELRRDGRVQKVTATVELRDHTEVDMAPLFYKLSLGDKTLLKMDPKTFVLPPGDQMQVRRLNPGREEQLEKKLKALEKRLNELESKLNKN